MVSVASKADLEMLEQTPYEHVVSARSMPELLTRAASEHGDNIALTWLRDADPATPAVHVSYAELLDGVRRAANLFHRLGIGEGDAVAIMAPNLPETQFALWGAEWAGSAFPLNVLLEVGHAASLVRAANAKVLVAFGPHAQLPIWQRALEVAERAGVALVAIGTEAADGAPVLNRLLQDERGDCLDFERPLARDTSAALFHTGGTTGAPKLARHLHGNQVHTSWSASLYYGLGPQDVLFNPFPVFHVAGAFVYGSSAFVTGARQVLPPPLGMRDAGFAGRLWDFVEREAVTVMCCVPTTLAMILQTARSETGDLPVRLFLTGGSPLPTGLADAVEQRFARPVRNILGMTECAGLISVEPAGGPRMPGSTGLRLPFAEVEAVAARPGGADISRPCREGETGVIVVRGPHVGPGYTDTSRNPGTFEGGWLITGDLGHVDGEGRVFVTGRAKDVIIRGAHNIDPSVIEEAMSRHPEVEMCAAVGLPDRHAGEVPVAYVVPKPGATVTEAELLEHARPNIPEPPARPRSVTVLDQMPLTAIGKIFKPALRRMATEQAFCDALGNVGVEGLAVKVEEWGGQMRVVVSVRSAADRESVAGALSGYAVPYEIVVAGDTHR